MAQRRSKKKASTRRRIGRPTGTRGKDTEERILNAAELAFAERGYAGCRTEDVAQSAGITRAMIHYYFESKDRLYHAVLDRILIELVGLVQDASAQQASRAARIRHFVEGFYDYVARHPHFGRLTFIGTGGDYFENIVNTFFRPMFDRGVAFIEDGVAEGEFRPVDARQMLLSIYALTMGYFADAHFIATLMRGDALSKRRVAQRRAQVLDMVCATLGIPTE